MLLVADRSQLLLVDMQERLVPAMADPEVVARAVTLARGAALLDVPVTVSEQYPKGLGPTVEALAEATARAPRLPKLAFSCLGDAAIAARLSGLRKGGRPHLVIAGIEAHVCVLQTALGARERGYDVAVVIDAMSSRAASSVEAARRRMAGAGVMPVTVEMVVFEWLGQAGGERFKAVSALIR
jgi:nicotinamidase-related amidase